jgi:hypothetical protein
MFAIVNFGHFWSRDNVEWGSKGAGNAGDLKGYRGSSKNKIIIDFKDQISIYILYTESREPIYVGQTGSGSSRLLSRLRNHTTNHLSNRWDYFSWFGLCPIKTKKTKNGLIYNIDEDHRGETEFSGINAQALNEIESVLLQILEPRLNKRGPNWGGTEEYFQYVAWEHGEEDQPVSYDTEVILAKILEQKKGE